MKIRKWISLVIGTSLLGSGLLALPASAGNPAAGNQSDITGTNVWNNTAPIFENGGKLNPDILNNARRLSQELGQAGERCCNAPPPAGPRRFALGAPDPNDVCVNPDCVKLNGVVQETKAFLDDVNRSRAEQVSANRNRAW
jgi:hypothetical protein